MPFGRSFGYLLWMLLVLVLVADCPAAGRPRVLILFSNDRLLPANQELENGLRKALVDENGNPTMDLFGEFLDSVRFSEPGHGSAMERFLIDRHRNQPPSVVVTAGPQAMDFLIQREASMFPGVPLVFCAVTPLQIAGLPADMNIAGRPMDWSIVPLLESLPAMRPAIRKILLVVGAAEFDRARHQEALAQIAPFRSRFQFESSEGEELEKLLERVSKLTDDTLVFYLSYFRTPDGRTMTPRDVAGRVARASRVPVVSVYDTYIGSGVLGGPVIPFEEEGFALGEIVRQVVATGNAGDVGILPAGKPRLVFDHRVMKRFGWADSALPHGSEIRFKTPSLWEAHRNSVLLGSGAILLQSALIIGLVFARARQQAAEKERQHSESRFLGVFRGSPVSISIIRQSDGRIIDVNPAWERTTGVSRDQVLGRSHLELGFGFEGSGDQRYLEYLASGKSLRDFEQHLRMPNGERRVLSVSSELVNLHGEPCYISMAKDITEIQQVEEARRKLQQASRLGMLGELTASIAHEINQPLGAILSNADAASILMESPEPPLHEIREILSDIRRDDMRASEVIRQVRSMVAKGEPHRVPLHPGELANEVAAMVRHDCKRRSISLLCEIAMDLPQVRGEKAGIEQVLLNLLLNAMESLKDADPKKRKIVMAIKLADNGLVDLSVTDSGPGIPSDVMGRIFENFFTTKSEGMGLGLALSRSIAEAHCGQLLAENAPGGGACFHLLLPPIP